jgi:adenosylcobinamide-GDP ribazoletransferase
MSDFMVALKFLTVIPLGRENVFSTGRMARSLSYYSLVGLLLGGLLVLVSMGGSALDLGWSGDIIVIAFLAFITGGLHLDGLADTADGLFSSRPREKKLQIMRDSRIGAMGAIVLWVFLSLKVAFLGELSGLDKVKLLIFMPAVGRGLMVWSIVKFPYARESGLGRPAQGGDWRSLAINASVLAASGFLFLGVYSLVIIVVVWVAVHLLSTFLSRELGGLTGDTYGAVCEFSETLTLFLGVMRW